MLTEITSTVPSLNGKVEEYTSWNNPLQAFIADENNRPDWVTDLVEGTVNWSENSIMVDAMARRSPKTTSRIK